MLDGRAGHSRIDSFLKRTAGATSLPELETEIHAMRDQLGAQHLLYHWINVKGEVFGAGTYSRAWRDHYLSNGYQSVDPVVHAAALRFHPLDWSRLDWSSRGARQLYDDARSAGVGTHGLTIPIRGPNGQFAHFTATLNGSDAEWQFFAESNLHDMLTAGHFLNQKALEIRGAEAVETGVVLSRREIDVLTSLALGYSRKDAAAALSISEHTLRVYVESARTKLKCANVTHTVAEAIKLGHVII